MATVGVTSSPVLKPVGPTLMAALAGTAPTAPPTPAAATTTLTPGAPPVTTAPTAPKAPIPITMDVPGPKTNALAQSLLQNAYGKKHDSPLEVVGGLAQVLAGTKAQREFETAEKARERLPTQQIQEYAAGGGGFGIEDAESLIATGVPSLVEYGVKLKAAQAEAALKPPQYQTVGNKVLREMPDGSLQEAYSAPMGVVPMTPEQVAAFPNLNPRAVWGWDQEKQAPVKLQDAPVANTAVGKIYQDVADGVYGPEVAQELLNKELAHWETLDTPEKRAAAGINPNDNSPWQRSPDGKLERIEVPATFTEFKDENGAIWSRNSVTNELTRKAEGYEPKLPTGYQWTDDTRTTAELVPGVPEKHAGSGGVTVSVGGEDKALTPGQKKLDELYAAEHLEWIRGGAFDTEQQLAQLEEAARRLGTEEGISGPFIGIIPDAWMAVAAPDAAEVRDAVFQVAARSLKAILGAQFAVAENLQFVQRAYNPALSQEENAKRVTRMMTQIRDMAQAKNEAAAYFQDNGTLAGWNGTLPSLSDVNPDVPIIGEYVQDTETGEWFRYKGGPADQPEGWEVSGPPPTAAPTTRVPH